MWVQAPTHILPYKQTWSVSNRTQSLMDYFQLWVQEPTQILSHKQTFSVSNRVPFMSTKANVLPPVVSTSKSTHFPI